MPAVAGVVYQRMALDTETVWGEKMTFARKLQIGMALTDVTPKELAAEVKSSMSSVYEWLGGKRRPHERRNSRPKAAIRKQVLLFPWCVWLSPGARAPEGPHYGA